jgi:hypothetical protein
MGNGSVPCPDTARGQTHTRERMQKRAGAGQRNANRYEFRNETGEQSRSEGASPASAERHRLSLPHGGPKNRERTRRSLFAFPLSRAGFFGYERPR